MNTNMTSEINRKDAKKRKPNSRIRGKILAGLIAVMLVCTGCGANAASTASNDSQTTSTSQEVQTAASKSEMFTERDLSGDYSESEAVSIELNGTSANVTAGSNSANAAAKGVKVDGGTITITQEGVYIVSGTLADGMIVVDADDAAKVQIVLKNANITSKTSAALYVKSADKVFVTTADGTTNALANGGSFTAIDDNNIDGAVFAKDDVTFNGSGALTVTSPAGHGIVGKDDVKIAGGNISITAAKHGVQANDSARFAEASVTINSGTDGVHVSDNADAEEGTASDSYFYMADGSLKIEAGDDGIHADAEANIEGGEITVGKSYEGIEALAVNIKGGDINVTATDDGINAAGGNSTGVTTKGNDSGNGADTNSGTTSGDAAGGAPETNAEVTAPNDASAETTGANSRGTFGDDDWAGGKGGFPGGGGFSDGGSDGSITISGGNTYVQAGGDGIDSNGSVTISGGYTVVCGPTQGDTSVLDYNGEATVTGGTFIGTGGAGMASGFSSAENQGIISVSVGNQAAGSAVTLKDESGKTIAEVTPELDYAVVYVSTEDLKQGSTYTLTAGSYSESIELTESIYSSISGGRGGMKGGQGGFGGGRGNMNSDDQSGDISNDQSEDGSSDQGFGGPQDGMNGEQRGFGGGHGGMRGGHHGFGGEQGGMTDDSQNAAPDAQTGATEKIDGEASAV